MRELTLEEQELIAGGLTTDGYDGGDGGEIVVTGNPGDGGGDYGDWGDFGDYGDYGDGGGGGGDAGDAGPTAADALAAHGSQQAVNNSSNHTPEADKAVNDLKQSFTDAMNAALHAGTNVTLPDGSQLTPAQMQDFLSRVQFEAVDTAFGNGRAGANTIGPDGLIHVEINVDQLIGYDAQGLAGTDYLIGHEIAHDTAGGIAESDAMWNQYLAEPGVSAMSDADKNANYPNSTQFQTNEAWANSAGKAITDALGIANIPNPTNGYYAGP